MGVTARYLRRVKCENARLSLSIKTSYYDVFTSLCSARSPSNPLHANKKRPDGRFLFGGEKGIRTPGTVITVHMISNHAPSASSDISPNNGVYYNK